MLRRMTLGGRLGAMMALLALLTVTVAASAGSGVLRAGNRQQASASEEDANLELLELARVAQVRARGQAQAWKALRLAGADDALDRQHREALLEEERLAQESLAGVGERMRARGIDTAGVDRAAERSTEEALDAAVAGIEAHARVRRDAHRAAAEELIVQTRLRVASMLALWFALGGFMSARIIRSITRPAQQALGVARALARGELGVSIDEPGTDELGLMLDSLGSMSGDLRRSIGETRDAAGTLVGAADEIAATTRLTVQSSQQQATAVQQTTASTAELAQTVQVTGERAAGVQRAMDRTLATSRQLREEVGATRDVLDVTREELRSIVESIGSLVSRNEQIDEIAESVREVADQTQLLAVNAGIEAVKAGELGRGFGVVAAEMKQLADQTKRSAQRIREIVGDVQRGTAEVVRGVEAGKARVQAALLPVGEMVPRFEELTEQVDESASSLGQILAVVRQQGAGIAQIDEAMKVVLGAARESLARNRQLDASAELLRGQARRLDAAVAAYRT